MIKLQQLTKTFPAGDEQVITALNQFDLAINKGDFTVVMGANGSGKSTLLNIVAGNLHPDSGKVLVNNIDITQTPEHKRSRFIARLFQNPLNGTAPELSILENFRLAALRTTGKKIKIGTDKNFRAKVAASVQSLHMELENKLDTAMGSLSGGQRQALTLLMCTMDSCDLLLMDEPTSALDPRSAETIMELANRIIQEKKLTAILITHRLKDGITYGNRLLYLENGKIKHDFSDEKKASLKSEDLFHLFGE
jgi:putative tryptophan/tyrosine transport system ATP-binding protein